MSLVVRLSRTGRKGERRFRVVVLEKRERRDGRALEELGFFQKGTTNGADKLNKERYKYWLSKGARPSTTVKEIMEKK